MGRPRFGKAKFGRQLEEILGKGHVLWEPVGSMPPKSDGPMKVEKPRWEPGRRADSWTVPRCMEPGEYPIYLVVVCAEERVERCCPGLERGLNPTPQDARELPRRFVSSEGRGTPSSN